MENLTRELEKVNSDQTRQVKEVLELREQVRTTLEQRERELTERHRMELEEQTRHIEKCQSEVSLAKIEMEREVTRLKERHTAELEAMKLSLMSEEKERGAAEIQKWQEKEKSLQDQLREKEESLAQRVSDFSEELRTARDELALARQRATESSEQLEVTQSELCGLHSQLDKGCNEREQLREQVRALQTRKDEEGKRWRDKLSEKEGENRHSLISNAQKESTLTTLLFTSTELFVKLEARHRQTVGELQSQLSALQERMREMEGERETLAIQHHSSIQQHSHSLSSMEKVSFCSTG